MLAAQAWLAHADDCLYSMGRPVAWAGQQLHGSMITRRAADPSPTSLHAVFDVHVTHSLITLARQLTASRAQLPGRDTSGCAQSFINTFWPHYVACMPCSQMPARSLQHQGKATMGRSCSVLRSWHGQGNPTITQPCVLFPVCCWAYCAFSL